MFNYVSDISNIAHNIIYRFCKGKELAVDATLGNGNDSIFLSKIFNRVISFDIQEVAIENIKAKKLNNVSLIHDSHEFIDKYIKSDIDCIMFNLGYLPGGNRSITTTTETTISSIKKSLNLLNFGGIMSVITYVGHEEGRKEKLEINKLLNKLTKKEFGILEHNFINRTNSPSLYIIEKNL